ncbi:MAG: RNase adapter RapZ [Oscillospiraceae bacterium]
MEVLIVTGLSGAGKTKVANVLEDIGFFCIDNMPPSLIPTFAEMAKQLKKFQNISIVTDVRAGKLFEGFEACLEELKKINVSYKILFLDASDNVLEKRYRETRRKHPLVTSEDSSIMDAIQKERQLLKPVFELADYHIDTTYLSISQLKDNLSSLFLENTNKLMTVRSISFGYKYGVPTEADIVLDVRCLPNPFYVDELKNKTGLDAEVRDYVLSCANTQGVLDRFYAMMDYMLPLYRHEGKSQLVIGIGCTGGKHRSVTIAEELCRHIKELDYDCRTFHRDITKIV